jgi:hypothetical protein
MYVRHCIEAVEGSPMDGGSGASPVQVLLPIALKTPLSCIGWPKRLSLLKLITTNIPVRARRLEYVEGERISSRGVWV